MNTPARGFASIAIILIFVLALAALGAEWYGSRTVPSTLNQAPIENASTTTPQETNTPPLSGATTVDAQNDITKDAAHVYQAGAIVADADPKTFVIVVTGVYYKDAAHVWVIPGIGKGVLQEIPGAD